MVREYIGARYVAKVYENSLDPSSAEWEANFAYEPLTIVTYNYNSYMSKKEVPSTVGNPATNPSYWVVTGQYNGQIAQLQAQVAALEERIITPEFFGATGDGVTNDHDAVDAAVSAALLNGATVQFDGTKSYYISGASIPICSMDWNGATLIMPNQNNPIFETQETPSITINTLTKNSVLESSLFEKSFLLRTPKALGNRGGETWYYLQEMITDKVGNFINDSVHITLVSGTYTAENPRSIHEKPVYIKNIVIDYSVNNHMCEAFLIRQNNVHVDGVMVKGEVATDYRSCGVIWFNKCANGTIENVVGGDPDAGTSPLMANYLIMLTCVSNMSIKNCCLYDNWDDLGQAYVTNMSYENILSNKIEYHQGQFGYYNIKNCIISGLDDSYIRFGYGYGIITIDNVIFNSNYVAVISQRADFDLGYYGKIIVKNCRFTPTIATYNAVRFGSINAKTDIADFDTLPTELYIENCILASNTDTYVRGFSQDTTNNNIHVTFRDVTFNGKLLGKQSGTNNEFGSLTVENCKDTFTSLQSNYIAAGTCKKLKVINSDFHYPTTKAATSEVELINSTIKYLSAHTNTYDVLIITNCKIQGDTALGDSATNEIVNDNVITATTKNNQSSWNGILI